jgi:hypothetical protein
VSNEFIAELRQTKVELSIEDEAELAYYRWKKRGGRSDLFAILPSITQENHASREDRLSEAIWKAAWLECSKSKGG